MKRITLVAAASVALALPAYGYRTDTHEVITEFALAASQLDSRVSDYGISFGMTQVNDVVSDGRFYFFGNVGFSMYRPIRTWIALGAVAEDDDCCFRYFRHFHNPRAPLGSEGFSGGQYASSMDWGLEERVTNSSQDYSLLDARQYLQKGILAPTESERKANLFKFFKSLGHAVHLIQDLAQPQHTRDDSHPFNATYEKYVNKDPSLLNYGNYGSVQFDRRAQYWVTGDGRGLAEYSNRGFVTQGRNFSGRKVGNTVTITMPPGFPEPSATEADIVKRDVTDADLLGEQQPVRGEVWFVERPVVDLRTQNTDLARRISTFSILDYDLVAVSGDWGFTLNRFNFDHNLALLLPRAVGYSAGLIDNFIRGKLALRAPEVGLYAYEDHKSSAGFKKIRVRVRNQTPGETLDGGKFVAAAKFHLNGCYQPDLSGEFTLDGSGNLVAPCASYRSSDETMLLSDEQSMTLAPDAEKEFTFTFPSEIPMAATDLYIQVVYTGPFKKGSDVSEADGIAVGAKDIAEPTFLALNNATDVFELPNPPTFWYWKEIRAGIASPPFNIVDKDNPPNGQYNTPPDDYIFGTSLRYELRMNGKLLATVPAVPEGRFARLALLVDPGSYAYQLTTSGTFFSSSGTYTSLAKTGQLNYATRQYVVSSVQPIREIKQWGSVTAYRYYFGSTPSALLKDMKKSVETGATDLVAFELEEFPPSPP
jgi:hypothetical protein